MNEKTTEVIREDIPMEALTGSTFLYRSWLGKTLDKRYEAFNNYINLRKEQGVYPFQRTLTTPVNNEIKVSHTWADENMYCLNFGSQDYLGLSNHSEVKQAAHKAIDEYGLNSGGSPVLSGKNTACSKLENTIASILGLDQCQLFPTGWMACFGVVAGLISHKDAIVMDMFVHNSLDVGTKYATEKVYKFKHNNMEELETKLKFCRKENSENGLFIIIESLYSMHSDMPDLDAVMKLAVVYDAIVIIDICHDFGSIGENGLGIFENFDITPYKDRLIVTGSLSKSFVTTGGFVAGPQVIRTQIEAFAPTYTFSTNITPINIAVAQQAIEIAFSEEGKGLRKALNEKSLYMIEEFNTRGFVTAGVPSAIVPVFVGDVKLARIMVRELSCEGVMVNLVEFPAVPKDKTLLRFQMMATMPKEHILTAAEKLSEVVKLSQSILLNSQISAI
jgi:7-keto-8-aminopelargonate synthetase-like enzyme